MIKRVLHLIVVLGLWVTPVWSDHNGQEDICHDPAVIMCDNFESRSAGYTDPWWNRLNQKVYKNTGWNLSGSWIAVTDDPANVYSGNKALEFNYPAGPRGTNFMGIGWTSNRTYYARWYTKWSSNYKFSPIATKHNEFKLQTSGASTGLFWNEFGQLTPKHIFIAANPGVKKLSQNENGKVSWELDRWYCLEIKVTMNSTSTSTDGNLEAWIDNVRHWNYTNVNLDRKIPNGIKGFLLSGYWNCKEKDCSGPNDTHPQMYRWHDNFVVSTNRIGCLTPFPTPFPPTGLRVE